MRVLSLIASSTEIVYRLGFGHLLVGRSHECDHPPEILALPRCTETKFNADGKSYEIDERVKAILQEGLSVYRVLGEKLKELKPDVIITQTQCEVCAVSEKDVIDALHSWLGEKPEVVSLQTNSLADLWTDIRKIALALKAPERGEKLIEELQAQIRETSRRAKKKAPPTPYKVACIEWIDPLMAAGNWIPEFIELLGAENLFGKAGLHSPWMTAAELEKSDPDFIFVFPCGFDVPRILKEMPLLERLPEWSRLRAVKAGNVFVLDGNAYFNRPGPRLVESLEILDEILYPKPGVNRLDPPPSKNQERYPRWLPYPSPGEPEFTLNEQGLTVFTRSFHLKRGFCCHSGCKNCPYPAD